MLGAKKDARRLRHAGRKSQEEPVSGGRYKDTTIRVTSTIEMQRADFLVAFVRVLQHLVFISQHSGLSLFIAQQHSIAADRPTHFFSEIKTVKVLFST